jgi:SAM-dependent methyltransferase
VSSDPRGDAQPDVWGEAARQHLEQSPLGWLDTDWVLRERVFPMVFGSDPGGWWTQGAMKRLGVPLGGRWLDLGCGGGAAEIDMARNGLFDSMVAYDPSPGAIQVAKEQASKAGVTNIDFRSADVNWFELPEGAFDVVHINMALHHVLELEHVAYQVNRALKPGGLFLANEFVGPSQFQFSPTRMMRVQASLESLPERLRWNPIAKEVKTEQPRYPRAWWDEFDPTESVRSDEIPHVLSVNFPTFRRLDYGGNLLNLVLENIAQNFDPNHPEDGDHIAALFATEDEMLLAEPSDFAYFVCPRGGAEALEAGRRLADATHGRFVRTDREPLETADLDALTGIANLRLESESGSARPVVGPVIAGVKRLVRRGLRFYIEPLARQQTEFNEASLRVQRRLLADMQREVAQLKNENTVLRRTLAERPGDSGTGGDPPA